MVKDTCTNKDLHKPKHSHSKVCTERRKNICPATLREFGRWRHLGDKCKDKNEAYEDGYY